MGDPEFFKNKKNVHIQRSTSWPISWKWIPMLIRFLQKRQEVIKLEFKAMML